MESLASIQKAIDYIEENLKNDISIGQVAAAIGYSEYHFLRIFKRFIGKKYTDFGNWGDGSPMAGSTRSSARMVVRERSLPALHDSR